ncbi:M1 family metallopeptidase [Microlunatus flavus]|uniref:Peptidase family M1 n=1 Tax=Microlunatus flavus TaxID=1036181 RepID=A0A1H9N1J6_9ACTN|nr:M1 family metallopeptidase [Microlunatus flavus]SER29860.1 Peptidase family M1 [Microlunatus flavus]
MSSVDPRWGPPLAGPPQPGPRPRRPADPRWGPPLAGPPQPGPRPRRPAYVYVLAVVVPLALVAALLLPLGVAALWRRLAADVPVSSAGAPGGTVVDGSRGLGDRYYPDAGNGGYDVTRYQIDVSFDPADERLSGTTTISARALQGLHSFVLDLRLDVATVTVDGADAGLARDGSADWRVTPATPVAAGRDFTVVVTYSGQPGEITGVDGDRPFTRTGEEWLVAGEPESAAWWFPSNDHPSDPALMDVSIRVPRGLQAISTGRLVSADSGSEERWDTWHWVSRQPMATFLTFMAIGSFTLQQGVVDGLPYVYAVTDQLSDADQKKAFAALQTSAATVRVLAGLFGPYPFTELGGIVPKAKLPFDGLETQGRPVYRAESIIDPRYSRELITHELAHMWFGDNVTVRQWDDIFDSEAYASWAAWAAEEKTGGATAQSQLTSLFDRARDADDFWRVTMIDPGRRNMFTTVYYRGPMALQALRNVMGDEAFTRLNTQWAQDPGSRSLEDWMTKAQSLTTTDLQPFFQAWIYARVAPAKTAANGLG